LPGQRNLRDITLRGTSEQVYATLAGLAPEGHGADAQKARRRAIDDTWDEKSYGRDAFNADAGGDELGERPGQWDQLDGISAGRRNGDWVADITFLRIPGHPPQWEAVVTRPLGAVPMILSRQHRELLRRRDSGLQLIGRHIARTQADFLATLDWSKLRPITQKTLAGLVRPDADGGKFTEGTLARLVANKTAKLPNGQNVLLSKLFYSHTSLIRKIKEILRTEVVRDPDGTVRDFKMLTVKELAQRCESGISDSYVRALLKGDGIPTDAKKRRDWYAEGHRI